jgi:predicted phosphate transport protein (TIGR00153 family)
MSFLFPKQPAFFEYFKDLSVCLKDLAALFSDFARDFNDFENYRNKAKEIEHKADTLTHEINQKLNETFITPFDREDLHMLAHETDDILDLIEAVISNVYIYGITERNDSVEDFAKLIKQASLDFEKLIHKCFLGKKDAHTMNDLVVQIHHLEDEGDMVFQKAIKDLFFKEKDPVQIIKWKELLENLEEVMDKFQRVSNIVENITIKSS